MNGDASRSEGRLQLDPGPLSGDEARGLTSLLDALVRAHPGILAFRLCGSTVDPGDALPCGDLDVSWYGRVDAASGDARVIHGNALFEHEGLLIDLARYGWSELDRLDDTALPAAVAMLWAHPLWEREPIFSRARRAVAPLLTNREWLARGVDRELERIRGHLARWRDPAARPALGAEFDLMRAWGGWLFLPLLAAVNLRQPSGSRRGLVELRRFTEALGLPSVWRELYSLMGVDRPGRSQVLDWSARVFQLFERARALGLEERQPRPRLMLRRRYYLEGIRALCAAGQEAEAIRPLWRAAHGLHELLGPTPDTTDAAALVGELREALGMTSHDDDVILPRLAQLTGIVDTLERHREQLLESVHREAVEHGV